MNNRIEITQTDYRKLEDMFTWIRVNIGNNPEYWITEWNGCRARYLKFKNPEDATLFKLQYEL